MLISSVDSVSVLAEVDFMNSIYTQRLVDINSEYTVAQLNYGNKAFSLPGRGYYSYLGRREMDRNERRYVKNGCEYSFVKI